MTIESGETRYAVDVLDNIAEGGTVVALKAGRSAQLSLKDGHDYFTLNHEGIVQLNDGKHLADVRDPITITIGRGADAEDATIRVMVHPNLTPHGKPLDTTLAVDGAAKTINFADYFRNRTGEEVTYQYAVSRSRVVERARFRGANLRLVGAAEGTTTITVTATPDRGKSATQEFTVRVSRASVPEPTGTPPVHLKPTPETETIATPEATATPTPRPIPTNTPTPEPEATAVATVEPTATPVPTVLPMPTSTPAPEGEGGIGIVGIIVSLIALVLIVGGGFYLLSRRGG